MVNRQMLYIPVGIPGCGKSGFAISMRPRVVVSSDAIRESMGDVNDQSRNAEVFERFYRTIRDNLELGLPDTTVYADATNLDARSRDDLAQIAQDCGASTHLILFRNTEQAIRRNAERERVVPAGAMMRMIEKYERALAAITHHEVYNYVTEVSSVR